MLPQNRYSTVTRDSDRIQTTTAFMSNVYLWMMVGVTITGLTAYYVASRSDLIQLFTQNRFIFFGLMVLQILMVLGLSAFVQRMSVGVASAMFALYTTSVGLTFSVLFLVYTMQSISVAFFVTAFSFAGLSAFAYLTKRDLGPVGSFCMMGLFGLIGIMVISWFVPSLLGNSTQYVISALGILIFAGLTAYDTQRIKSLQLQMASSDSATKNAIYGALVLYLDFINLFINILFFVGDRR